MSFYKTSEGHIYSLLFATTPQILCFFSPVSPVPCCLTESFLLCRSGVRSLRAAGSDCRQCGFRAVNPSTWGHLKPS